jgi:hypothetical protein
MSQDYWISNVRLKIPGRVIPAIKRQEAVFDASKMRPEGLSAMDGANQSRDPVKNSSFSLYSLNE